MFQWRGGGLNREILARILEDAVKTAALRGKYVHMSMNPGQLVIELSLINKKDDGGICVEAANDGRAFRWQGLILRSIRNVTIHRNRGQQHPFRRRQKKRRS